MCSRRQQGEGSLLVHNTYPRICSWTSRVFSPHNIRNSSSDSRSVYSCSLCCDACRLVHVKWLFLVYEMLKFVCRENLVFLIVAVIKNFLTLGNFNVKKMLNECGKIAATDNKLKAKWKYRLPRWIFFSFSFFHRLL